METWWRSAWQTFADVWSFSLYEVDGTRLTLGRLVVATLLVILSVYLSRKIAILIGKRLLPRLGLSQGAIGAFESLSFYVFLIFFTLMALRLAGVPYGLFAVLGGALAIGLGFGSQNVVNNFISGVIMMVEQPVKLGDLVEVEGTFGTVAHIGPRSTQVRTPENTHVVVPNSYFLEKTILNWTLSDNTVRTTLKVGVAYGSQTERVRDLLKQAADSHDNVVKMPEPLVLFTDFGDNALAFELIFWVRMDSMMERRRIESELRFTVDKLFAESDVVIAFPQRDVHLDSARPIEVKMLTGAS